MLKVTTKFIEKTQEVKARFVTMTLINGDMPDGVREMMAELDDLMDLSCEVMYANAKKLDTIDEKLDKLLAK